MTTTACPSCGSKRIYRSRRRHLAERTLAMLGSDMRRCHECNTRYARFGRSLVQTGDLRGVSRKFYWTLTMAAAVVFIMSAILWFSRVQAAPGPDTGSIVPAGRPEAVRLSGNCRQSSPAAVNAARGQRLIRV
jgi:predicted RNA-binding Zn-ribbon protein involved in translation (DUF1610 family)